MNHVTHRGKVKSYVLLIVFIIVCLSACESRVDTGLAQEKNGEVIYYHGYNNRGDAIPFRGGPHWMYMHGGSCVDCHGRDGRGGFIHFDSLFVFLRHCAAWVCGILSQCRKKAFRKPAWDYCLLELRSLLRRLFPG